ncbi:hypothetical protein [Bradyrhizobium sp. STM 3561]|uniref:hypothetical protein n=1 Tax=Bradyrhizobium sp. STM 3561 TaxID=578923 RepID=UPI00389074BD
MVQITAPSRNSKLGTVASSTSWAGVAMWVVRFARRSDFEVERIAISFHQKDGQRFASRALAGRG